jgi:hypothetical protein
MLHSIFDNIVLQDLTLEIINLDHELRLSSQHRAQITYPCVDVHVISLACYYINSCMNNM